MTIIYMLMGILAGLNSFVLADRFFKTESSQTLLTAIIVALVMIATKILIIPDYEAATFSTVLKITDPVFRMIEANYPQQYNDYIDEVKEGILMHQTENFETISTLVFLNSISETLVTKATDKAIFNFYKIEVEMDKELFTVDPKLVLYMEFPQHFRDNADPSLLVLISGDTLVKKVIQSKEELIISALKTPQPALTSAEAERAFQKTKAIMQELSVDVGGQDALLKMIGHPENNDVDKKEAALLIINFYEKILAQGQGQAADIFQYLVAAPH
jgi:hypothetical protein